MKDKIKKCPFCGDQGFVYMNSDAESTWFGVECRTCDFALTYHNTENQAITAWNKRYEEKD